MLFLIWSLNWLFPGLAALSQSSLNLEEGKLKHRLLLGQALISGLLYQELSFYPNFLMEDHVEIKRKLRKFVVCFEFCPQLATTVSEAAGCAN